MSLTDTPNANRLHITLFGRRNSGKSSLINALTGQDIALVSNTPGTTTDLVSKAMEIQGIGPCLFIDTPGFDDEGELGELRISRTLKAIEKTDIALLLCGDTTFSHEKEMLALLKEKNIPVIPVLNKIDIRENSDSLATYIEEECKIRPLLISAKEKTGIEQIRQAILEKLPSDFGQQSITGELVTENALVALYFACCDEKCTNKNGEVIVFKDTQRTVGNYPIIEAIADTYRLCRGTWIRPKEFFQNAQNMDYFAEQKYLLQLMNNNKRDNKDASFISDYDSWLLGIANNPLFIYAPFTNLRQRMQQGRYILFPNAIDKENDTVIIKDLIRPISKDSECVVARIQIAAEDKENILRELKFFGISRQTLFPDNVDIVCDEIKKAAYNKIQDKN